jgi:CRP-like cAMP-binding protein
MRYVNNYEIPEHSNPNLVGLGRRSREHKPSREDLREAELRLREFGYLDGVSDEDLHRLAENACPFTYPAQWTVIKQGTVPDRCLMIVEGSVRFHRAGEVMGTAGRGALIGLDDALAHRTARLSVVSDAPLTGVAVETTMLREILTVPAEAGGASAPVVGVIPRPALG